MNRNVLFIILLVSLIGCAGRPTAEQLKNANYGSYPENYKEITQQFIADKVMKDSIYKKIFQGRESISHDPMYTGWRGPSKGWYSTSGSTYFGYRVCVVVHPRSISGGLKSRDMFFIFIYNDNVIQYEHEKSSGEDQLHKLCNFKNSPPSGTPD